MSGKSALVLFYHVISCAQYEVSVMRSLGDFKWKCPYLIVFTNHMYL